jgi:hypothetical protein
MEAASIVNSTFIDIKAPRGIMWIDFISSPTSTLYLTINMLTKLLASSITSSTQVFQNARVEIIRKLHVEGTVASIIAMDIVT